MSTATEMKNSEREVMLRGFPKIKKKQLTNIAKNLGISANDWGKMRLCEAIDAAPEHLKRDPMQ